MICHSLQKKVINYCVMKMRMRDLDEGGSALPSVAFGACLHAPCTCLVFLQPKVASIFRAHMWSKSGSQKNGLFACYSRAQSEKKRAAIDCFLCY